MKKLICKKCSYEWYPRDPEKKPVKCPECQSRDWNEDKPEEKTK